MNIDVGIASLQHLQQLTGIGYHMRASNVLAQSQMLLCEHGANHARQILLKMMLEVYL